MSLKQYNNYTAGGSNPEAPSQNNIDPWSTGLAVGQWALEKGIQAGQNKKQREFEERMTRDQWKEDQRRWELQNAYNTPAMMMQRYKEAGLNPALMYKGTATPAGSMAKAEKQTGKFGLGDSQLQIAQVANLMAQTESIRLENEKKKYDLGYKEPESKIDSITMADGTVKIEKTTRNVPYYNKIKAESENAMNQSRVSALSARLADEGWRIQDPVLLRMVGTTLQDMGVSIKDVTSTTLKTALRKLGYTWAE